MSTAIGVGFLIFLIVSLILYFAPEHIARHLNRRTTSRLQRLPLHDNDLGEGTSHDAARSDGR